MVLICIFLLICGAKYLFKYLLAASKYLFYLLVSVYMCGSEFIYMYQVHAGACGGQKVKRGHQII